MELIVEGKGVHLGKHQGRLRVTQQQKTITEAPLIHLQHVLIIAAAVLIAAQLPAGHWFYLYVVWFAPFVLIALFAAHFPLDIPRGTQIPSGMRVWSTLSSSPISSASRRSRRRKATIELPR